VEHKPKRGAIRILEIAGIFALSALLLRLGAVLIAEVWWILLIIAIVAAGAVIGCRIWKNRSGY